MPSIHLQAGVIIFLLVALPICAAASGPSENITLFTSKAWLVANGSTVYPVNPNPDMDLVSVNVGGSIPGNNSRVSFTVNDTEYGYFNPTSAMIVNGTAAVNFVARVKSGTANITAVVTNATTSEEYGFNTVIQRIDHDTPYTISKYSLKSEATVGTIVPIVVWVQDSHNNPVDNRRELYYGTTPEAVDFIITGSPPYAYFSPDGSNSTTVTRHVNESGAVEADVVLSTQPGTHNVMATALFPNPVSKKWTIDSIADGLPEVIACQITPYAEPHPYTPADDEHEFTFLYSLYDQYGNGLQAKDIHITTTMGDTFTIGTNLTGQQLFWYGPSDEVALIDITATAVDNPNVTRTDTIEFVHTNASNMVFTATPLELQSADVPPAKNSSLSAHVMDSEGNPVEGQPVKFTITSIGYGGNYSALYAPWLKNETSTGNLTTVWATTGNDGIATVTLTPCLFNTNKSDTNSSHPYVASATGYCTVQAVWVNNITGVPITHSLDFIFKNYPYLSAKTTLSRNEIPVNGTVDVSVYLSGDGFSLLPNPIDVMLVCDRSGSMGTQDMQNMQGQSNTWTRWRAEQYAANVFISKMNSSTDRLGLVRYNTDTYNHNNYDYNLGSPDYSVGTSFATITNAINTTTATGNTATRKALKVAIEGMQNVQNPDPRAVRAIILMTDGEYNQFGDPLARGYGKLQNNNWGDGTLSYHTMFSTPALGGVQNSFDSNKNTNQNMSLYAKTTSSNTLRIYTISFSSDITNGSNTWNTLEYLSQSTGGKHYHATTTQSLVDVYAQIAGELKNKAGVNTNASLSFDNILVKNVTVPGAEALQYQYIYGTSTFEEKWNQNGYTFRSYDNSTQWNTTHSLTFPVGTIYIGDLWKVTFRLKALMDGDIHIFDTDSAIVFDNNGTQQSIPLPDTVLKVIPAASNDTGTSGEFTETDVNVTPITDTTYNWQWSRHYTGNQEVFETYYISLDGGQQWIAVGNLVLSPSEARNQTSGSFIYDIRNILPSGMQLTDITVDFKIKAIAQDAPSPRTPRAQPVYLTMLSNRTYITLQ